MEKILLLNVLNNKKKKTSDINSINTNKLI